MLFFILCFMVVWMKTSILHLLYNDGNMFMNYHGSIQIKSITFNLMTQNVTKCEKDQAI